MTGRDWKGKLLVGGVEVRRGETANLRDGENERLGGMAMAAERC